MVKISSFELENIKRIKAVRLEPTENGLTVIGGRNGQGKTSVLDSIAWALGGEKYRPSEPQREGSLLPPHLKITLSNGLVVERKGKNSALTVTDPAGRKAGQQLLNEFVEQLALDLPKFLNASGKEKADILLKIIGVGDRLTAMELKEHTLYQERLAIGRIADQKAKFAKELPEYPDVPQDLISASELIAQQQEILARNGENQRKRQNVSRLEETAGTLQKEMDRLKKELTAVLADLETARKSAAFLHDESTAELEENIRSIDELNRKIRANLDREKAQEEAAAYQSQYDSYTQQIEEVRFQRTALLDHADLPLPGLSVEDGELTYQGKKWDCMSASEQLRAGTAIVRRLNPECGFVLLDKLEQMDLNTLREFGEWLEGEGLQAIATRVSTGGECSIIIEDGENMPTISGQNGESSARKEESRTPGINGQSGESSARGVTGSRQPEPDAGQSGRGDMAARTPGWKVGVF